MKSVLPRLALGIALAAAAPVLTAAETAPRLEIEWLGAATMRLTFDGHQLLTDPALGEGAQAFEMLDPNAPAGDAPPVPVMHRRLTPLPAVPLDGVGHVLVSHLHEDHFDQKAAATLRRNVPVVLPEIDAPRLRELGFVAGRPTDWNQTLRIETAHGSIEITAVPAEHSTNPDVAAKLGRGNGYWMTFRQGDWRRSVYWTGDTFPTAQVIARIQPLGAPDLLIGHVGGVGGNGGMFGQLSMRGSDLRTLADAIHPRAVLPIHHSTHALYLEPVWKVAEQFSDGAYRYDQISAGSTLIID